MTTLTNVIETVKIDKYSFQIYKRDLTNSRFKNRPFAVLYEKATPKGKYSKSKIVEHYVFETLEKCEEYITKIYGRIHANIKSDKIAKEEKRLEQKSVKASDQYEVGSIIYNSWGYEQTNVSFYQVISMTAKTITVQEIGQEIEEGSMYAHGMAHQALGIKDSFLENADEFRLTVRPKGRLSGGQSYYHFSKWDGKSKYVSSYY